MITHGNGATARPGYDIPRFRRSFADASVIGEQGRVVHRIRAYARWLRFCAWHAEQLASTLADHDHDWDRETDYCLTCGADGRA